MILAQFVKELVIVPYIIFSVIILFK